MSILTASKGVNKKLLEENGILPEDFIYEKHGIDSAQFALSNEFYAYNLEDYKEIFDDVKNRLAEEKKVLDSINNIEAEERKKLRDQKNTVEKPATIIPSKKIDTSQLVKRQ
jgi:DNA replication initiation complex subunit (GINS family)